MKTLKPFQITAVLFSLSISWAAHAMTMPRNSDDGLIKVIPFGEGGQLKMIYDRRQRPQAIYMNDFVYMVYNGGSHMEGGKGKKTFPFVISYDPEADKLGEPIILGAKSSGDQHYCPIIWPDSNRQLHILYGCHRTRGTHLISKQPGSIGTSLDDWVEGPVICDSMSYPTIFNIYDNKHLIYFRTGEHRSSWSYLISDDNCRTWKGPERHVTDLNRGDELNVDKNPLEMNEMSSYQTVLPSKDGKFLHVAFCSYDDNKKNVAEKFYNPRYQTSDNFSFKYNLYYVKVDLQSHDVFNFAGEKIKTPVDYETALAKCRIWDTGWRGAGVPPDIILDEKDNPAFLHVLSGNTPYDYNYHYIRYDNGQWKDTLVAPSSDDWNSCYLRIADDGNLYACLVMGEPFYRDDNAEHSGEMDSRGGGEIVEWVSTDGGETWSLNKDLTPRSKEFAGWKFNNVQPVKRVNGTVVDGMYLFYGWNDPEARTARAFLVINEESRGFQ